MAIFEKLKTVVRSMSGMQERRTVQPVGDRIEEAQTLIEQGNALEDAGQLERARALYENAVKIAPTLGKAYLNLGNILLALDQPQEAVEAYSTALVRQPNWPAAYFNMANALVASNRLIDAIASYDQALLINASFVDALVAKGNVHGDLKDFESSVTCYRKAIQIEPNYAEVWLNLGQTYRSLGRMSEALECFNMVLKLSSDSPGLHHSIGLAYKGLDRLNDAADSFKKAVSLQPGYATAQIDLANTYRELGDIGKAIEIARSVIALAPNESGAWSLLFFCLSDSEEIDKQTLFAEHRRFGEHFEPQFQSSWRPHQNLRDTERVLQVGVVSGDLSNHAVASFFEPILLHFLKLPTLSIHIYETSGREDDVTRRIKAQVKHWNDVEMLSADTLANLIRQHRIDVLIDLSGHTPANRLLTFARKPAPIQMSWIGYAGTTGLKSIDYYVGDRYFLPFGEYDDLFTEKILRIPANAPFQPAPHAPEVNDLPALKNGYVTFASFNRIDKIGRSVVRLWSSLLRGVPNSKMIIAGMPLGGSFDHLIIWFAEEGIQEDRLEFHRRSGMADYLKMHHRVDICLDTFPYGGGTTTCHALWMGVPTLTLAGGTPTAGAGRSILLHLDLDNIFCANDQVEFNNKGLWCVENLDYLQKLRHMLRDRFHKSALSQPSTVAGGLEFAMRHAWRRWCADLPAIPFEVTHYAGQFNIVDKNSDFGV